MNDVAGVPGGKNRLHELRREIITRMRPKGNTFFGPLSFKTKYDIWVTTDQAGGQDMAGYCPSSFFTCLWA